MKLVSAKDVAAGRNSSLKSAEFHAGSMSKNPGTRASPHLPDPTRLVGAATGLPSIGPFEAAPDRREETETLFRQLVHDHQKRLHRFILKYIGNSADAEDLVQQAFVEAARSYASYRGDSALSTWLYGIAMNLTRNFLSRAPHRKYTFEDEQSLSHLASHAPDPAEAMTQRQALNALQAELVELPAEMREVLLLVALDEVSYEEAAVMLSIPVGTVRSRVSRARAKLRQRLDEAGIELDF